MSSIDVFKEQVHSTFAALELSDDDLRVLSEGLDLPSTASTVDELVQLAFGLHKEINLLHATVGRWPDQPKLSSLLGTWERDANLQDLWTEKASARDLQTAKAHYTLVDKALPESAGEDRRETVVRLLRKISRALIDHPDNANGEYEVYGTVRATEFVGTGAIATVYRGIHLLTGNTVTVQVLKREAAGNPNLVEFLTVAAKQLQSIDHPQIVRVLEIPTPDARPRLRPFFVVEWSGLSTLEDLIPSEDFSLVQRQQVAVKLCQGLAYAHGKQLVHGNLKPANILVDPGNRIRLSDFLAVRGELAEQVWPEVIKKVGTPYYLAPEVTTGQPPSVRSDIFSLGRLLFRLFSRKEENLYDVMVPQLFKQELDRHLGSYPDLVAVLERCTALKPEDRPETVSAVLAELHRFGGLLKVDADDTVAALRASGQWLELIESQSQGLESKPAELQVAVLEDMADIQEYVLLDPMGALSTWARALAVDPGALEGQIESHLDRLSTDLATPAAARTMAEGIAAVLEKGMIPPGDESLRLHLKAAQLLHHQVGAQGSATALYHGALQIQPTNPIAYAALETIYTEGEHWSALVNLLQGKLETLTTDQERIAVLFRIADVQEQCLADLPAAAESYQQIRRLDERNWDAYTHLERLYRRLEHYDQLASLLEEEIAHCAESSQAVELMFNLATVLESRLDKPVEAIDLYRKILEISPDHPETLSSLESLMVIDVEALAAARILEPRYREQGSWSKLASALEVLLTAVDPEDDTWVSNLEEIARIREEKEQNPQAAFTAYAQLHRGRPKLQRVWDELEHLAAVCEEPQWREVVALFRRTVDDYRELPEPDRDAIVSLLLRMGRLQAEQLADIPAAIQAYREVLEISERHMEALSQLEKLYGQMGNWQEQVQVLDLERLNLLDAGKPLEALELLRRMAALWEEKLGSPLQAIECYALALEIHGEDPIAISQLERFSSEADHVTAVAAILEPYYTRREAWDELLALWGRKLELDRSLTGTARAESSIRMARIAEEKQQRPDRAFEFYIRAVSDDTVREDIQTDLERVTEAIGEWRRLIDFYDELLAAEAIADRDHRQAMLLKLAAWYRDRLGDLSQAERRYQKVIEISPDHPEALDALDALYSQQEQYPQLYEVLSRRAALTSDVEETKQLLFRMARIADEQLGDQKRAIAAYSQIVDLDEGDRTALEGLAAIYERQGNHGQLLSTLKRRAAAEAEPGARVGLLTRIGDLARLELNDPKTARTAYEEALALRPAKPRETIVALSQLYLDAGDLGAWFALLPEYLQHTASDQEAVQLHLKAAELAVRPNAPADADRTSHYEAVLQVAPYHQDVLLALERAYTEQERWRELLDIYRRQFIRIHLKAADLAYSHLVDADTAIHHLQQARDLDPQRTEVIDRLRAIYEEQGDWAKVVQLGYQKLELLGDDREAKRGLLYDLARALEKQGEIDNAIDCLSKLVVLHPKDSRSLVQLVRLSILQGRYSEIVGPIVKQIQEGDQAEEVMPVVKALGYLDRVLTSLTAQKPETAGKVLERLLQVERLDAELALELVVPPFEHYQASAELISILEGYVESPDLAGPWRLALFRACAQLHERTGKPDKAFALYTRLFSGFPGDVDGRENMLRLGRQLDRAAESIGAIESMLIQGVPETELAVDLSLVAASLFDGGDPQRSNPQRAIEHYRRVLALSPGHPAALRSLDRLYRQLERWPELREILMERIVHAANITEKSEIQVQLATLLQRSFNEVQPAAELCVEVLGSAVGRDEKPRQEALAMLEGISEEAVRKDPALFLNLAGVLRVEYTRAKDRVKLLSLLERRLQLLQGEANRKQRFELLVEMARLAREFEDSDAAFRYTLGALREDARSAELFASLEDLARKLGRWQQLVSFQSACLDRSDLPSEAFRLELALKNARWLYEHLNRKEDALASYKFALTLDETNHTALSGLEAVYEELGQREPLYHLLNKRAELSSDPAQRRSYLYRAARLAHHQLSQRDRAIFCYNAILNEYGPDPELLGDLEHLYKTAGMHQDLLRVLILQLESAREANPEVVGAMLLRIGRLARTELADPERAIPFYLEALEHHEVRMEALGVLVELYEQLEEWQKLVELIQAQIPQVTGEPEGLELSLKGARLAEEKLKDVDLAIALYQSARQADPSSEEPFQSVIRLMRQSGRWRNLLALLRAEMERKPEDRPFQTSLALQIAEIAVDPEKVGNVQMAHQYLHYALQIDPENAQAAQLLVRLHIAQQQWKEAVDLLHVMLEKAVEPKDSIPILVQRGDLYLDHLNQPDLAAEDYRKAFELDRARSETVTRLARLLEQQGDWEGLISLLDAHAAEIPDLSMKVAVALKTAKLIREKRMPSERLFAVLESALALNPPYPANVDVILQLVNANYALRNLEKVTQFAEMGLEYLKKAKDKKAEATLWYYKGLAATGQQKYEEALEAHKNCQRLDSNHVLNLIALSQLLSAAREWDQAIKTLQLVLLKQSDLDTRQRVDVYYMLGVAFANLKDKQRAEDMFGRVLLLDKNHAPTLRALEAIKNL